LILDQPASDVLDGASETGPDSWIQVGKVSGVYGVKGWVRIFSYTDPRDNILKYSPCYLKMGGKWVERAVLSGKQHGKGVVAQFSGCQTRDDAMALMDTAIAVRRGQLPELEANEFYWTDLVGLTVVTVEGVNLGEVVQLLKTGANDVLVVKSKDKERCIPYIRPDVIRSVSLQKKLIEVDWDPEF